MEINPVLVEIVTFGVVFLPYLFLSLFLNRGTIPQENVEARNLPPVIKFIWKPLHFFSESMESVTAMISPETIKTVKNRLIVANIRMSMEQMVAAGLMLGISFSTISVLFVLFFTTNGVILILTFLITLAMGLFYPFTTVDDLATKRQHKIMRSLPFAIDLIGSAMRAGVDFTAAVRYYVSTEDEKNPLAVEFGIMLRQLELGKTRIQAMEEMAARVQTDGFSAFSAALTHGFDVGASIVETMKIQSAEMRRERFNIAERKAARAASAMIFPIAVFIMPAMFVIIGVPIYIQVAGSGLGGLMQ